MNRALLIVVVIFALFLFSFLVMMLAARWVTSEMVRSFAAAYEAVHRGPLEHPTASALEYRANLSVETKLQMVEGHALVSGMIVNKGRRAISQFVIQINLHDEEGNTITWAQGPVIRFFKEEVGFIVKSTAVGEEHYAFSHAESPFQPGQTITFSKAFGAEDAEGAAGAGIEVMDIRFAREETNQG